MAAVAMRRKVEAAMEDEMPSNEATGLSLAAAIESIRSELLAARASGEKADIRLPVQSVAVELQVVATKGLEGKAGFKVPVLDLELGGSGNKSWEHGSTVTVVFGPPVDRMGAPLKIAEGTTLPKG